MSHRVLLAAYAFAHFGKSLLWHCSALIFAFYLTEVIGLTPRRMGMVLAASLLLNAFCDLGFGWIMGRWVRDLRSAARAQVFGAGLACLSFVAFAAVGAASEEARELVAIAWLIAFRIGYSLLDVPQNTILAFIASDDAGRTKVSALRYASAGVALLVVTLALVPWLASATQSERAAYFFTFAACLAPVTIATSVVLWGVAARHQPHLAPVDPARIDAPHTAGFGLFLPLASVLIYSSCMPLFSKLEAYFVAYSPASNGVDFFMAAVAAGQVIAQLLWISLASRLALISIYRWAAAGLGLVALAFVAAALSGGAVLLAVAALYGGLSSGLLATIWALLARSAAASPAKATLRFGQFTFCSKLAQAVSALVLGEVLGIFDYAQTSQHLTLIWAMALGPLLTAMACSILGSVFYTRYRRIRAAHESKA